MRHVSLPVLVLTLAAALGGCTDPFLHAGTWRATGVNDDNLRAMVADPRDLDRGVAEPGGTGQLAVAAITRLRTGKVKPLPDTGISKVGGGTSSSASPAEGGG